MLVKLLVTIIFLVLAAGFAQAGVEHRTGHDFSFTSIDESGSIDMSSFDGKVVLVVNTASFCGFTDQYQGLEKLWQKYRKAGLVVLGVPSNDFGGQEPHKESKIQEFCQGAFNISFPMTKKYHVIGPQAHSFFRWVSSKSDRRATPKWNFHKLLIGKNGALLKWFPSSVEPTSKPVIEIIENELRAPAVISGQQG